MIKLLPWPGSLEGRNIIDELWTVRSVEIDAPSGKQVALELAGFITDHGTIDQGFHDLFTCVVRSRQYRLAHALLLAWFGEERRQKDKTQE